jgi:hypothetical protein
VKDYLAETIRGLENPLQARNLVREYLQARILGALQRAGAFVPLAFQGGTSLRFLFGIPRWSEDLDFALERPGAAYDFRALLDAVRAELRREAYAVDLAKVNDTRTVHAGFVRFPGLFHELGLSGHRDEAVSVKLEVDTRPPAGAVLETTMVRRHVLLRLQHHDRASLLAGKLHAVLQRAYPKGRDLYDLVWYLSDRAWPGPNLAMLNAALEQTAWTGPRLAAANWRRVVRQHVEGLPWSRIVADARPFLERTDDAALLTRENLVALLG